MPKILELAVYGEGCKAHSGRGTGDGDTTEPPGSCWREEWLLWPFQDLLLLLSHLQHPQPQGATAVRAWPGDPRWGWSPPLGAAEGPLGGPGVQHLQQVPAGASNPLQKPQPCNFCN